MLFSALLLQLAAAGSSAAAASYHTGISFVNVTCEQKYSYFFDGSSESVGDAECGRLVRVGRGRVHRAHLDECGHEDDEADADQQSSPPVSLIIIFGTHNEL